MTKYPSQAQNLDAQEEPLANGMQADLTVSGEACLAMLLAMYQFSRVSFVSFNHLPLPKSVSFTKISSLSQTVCINKGCEIGRPSSRNSGFFISIRDLIVSFTSAVEPIPRDIWSGRRSECASNSHSSIS